MESLIGKRPNTITPEQAYEYLKDLQADLEQAMLMGPTETDGPDALNEYEDAVATLRAKISLLENYSSNVPPNLDGPL